MISEGDDNLIELAGKEVMGPHISERGQFACLHLLRTKRMRSIVRGGFAASYNRAGKVFEFSLNDFS